MNRILIIGMHPRGINPSLLPGGEVIDFTDTVTYHRKGDWYTSVYGCNDKADLVAALRDARQQGPIELIDILDHGIPGGILIGDEILFQHDGKTLLRGCDVLSAFSVAMSNTGQLRLLGCKTGLEHSGRCMLFALSRGLGPHRVVFGTIGRVLNQHFQPTLGFAESEEMLFSSLAAVDGPAQSELDRIKHIVEMGGYAVASCASVSAPTRSAEVAPTLIARSRNGSQSRSLWRDPGVSSAK